MNDSMHPTLRPFVQWFAPPARIDADPSPIIAGRSSRESSNDGPAFIRTPELDRRVSSGASFNANAWREVATGRTRYLCTGYDVNSGQWERIDLSRSCDQRAASRELRR